jgi:hypothetical protein
MVQTRAVPGEEITAATRAVLALSLGVGAVAAGGSALIGDPLVLVSIPTLALAAAIARGATTPAAYAAACLWLMFLLRVQGEALLVPIAMAVICLAVALGPDCLEAWFSDTREPQPPRAAEEGWIEEG